MLLLRKTSRKKPFSRYGEKRIFSLHKKGGVATWIFTIARNLRIDRIRRQAPFQDLPDEMHEVASEDDLPDEALNRSQQRERIRKVL